MLHDNSAGSSRGLSIKDMLFSDEDSDDLQHQRKLSLNQHSSILLSTDALKREESIKSECCFRLCSKTKVCGYIPCGRFHNRKHALYCSFFSIMITSLLCSVIFPLVYI